MREWGIGCLGLGNVGYGDRVNTGVEWRYGKWGMGMGRGLGNGL